MKRRIVMGLGCALFALSGCGSSEPSGEVSIFVEDPAGGALPLDVLLHSRSGELIAHLTTDDGWAGADVSGAVDVSVLFPSNRHIRTVFDVLPGDEVHVSAGAPVRTQLSLEFPAQNPPDGVDYYVDTGCYRASASPPAAAEVPLYGSCDDDELTAVAVAFGQQVFDPVAYAVAFDAPVTEPTMTVAFDTWSTDFAEIPLALSGDINLYGVRVAPVANDYAIGSFLLFAYHGGSARVPNEDWPGYEALFMTSNTFDRQRVVRRTIARPASLTFDGATDFPFPSIEGATTDTTTPERPVLSWTTDPAHENADLATTFMLGLDEGYPSVWWVTVGPPSRASVRFPELPADLDDWSFKGELYDAIVTVEEYSDLDGDRPWIRYYGTPPPPEFEGATTELRLQL